MKALKSALRSSVIGLRTISSSQMLQQAGWLAIAKIVQGVASVLATFIVARHLGPTAFGQLSLAIAAASFVAAAATLGLEQIATRELALDESHSHRNILPSLQRLRIAGATIGSAILLASAYLPAVASLGLASLLLVLCLLPLTQIGDLWEWRLIAVGNSKRVASIAITLSPLAALVRVCLALSGAGVVTFAWILIAEWTVRSILLATASRGILIKPQGNASTLLTNAISLLRDSTPLLFSGIAIFVYMRLDQFMIAAMLGTRQVGLYSAVVTLAEIPLVLPSLLLRAALPELTRQSTNDPAQCQRTLASLMRSGFFLHAIIAVVLCIFATPITVLLYGEPFREASMALRLQILAVPFTAMGVLSSAWLVLQRCTGHAFRRTAIGAIANIALNLFLIPRYGIAGAAVATLVSQIIATYIADAFYNQTYDLFLMKTHALLPGFRGFP